MKRPDAGAKRIESDLVRLRVIQTIDFVRGLETGAGAIGPSASNRTFYGSSSAERRRFQIVNLAPTQS